MDLAFLCDMDHVPDRQVCDRARRNSEDTPGAVEEIWMQLQFSGASSNRNEVETSISGTGFAYIGDRF